jgi:2-oxoisovalerate dehydrogenase E1 component
MCDALEYAAAEQLPCILECNTLRLSGHAVYDKGEYVSQAEWDEWAKRDPLLRVRQACASVCKVSEAQIEIIDKEIDAEIDAAVSEASSKARPSPSEPPMLVFAPSGSRKVKPFEARGLTNQTAVTAALGYLLENEPAAYLTGLDIGAYGSAFKTCKGLVDRFGPKRVINMPLAESAITGFALGSSQTGMRPVVEFQFADFVTEAITQLGLNCGTWYFRSGNPAPVVIRLPCGGGVTLGAFHSGEFDGLLARLNGLKLLYPTTPQEMFEAQVAAYYDPNPCVVFEHKLLYTRAKGDVVFDGNLDTIWKCRRYTEGSMLTVVATGAMVEVALTAAGRAGCSADVFNPYVLCPLDLDPVLESVKRTGRLLVVQESGDTAGMGNTVVGRVCRSTFGALKAAPVLVSAPDLPVPFAPELESRHRPDVDRVVSAMKTLCEDLL